MIEKMSNFINKITDGVKSGFERIQAPLKDKKSIKKLVVVITILLLIMLIVALIGYLILSIYCFIDTHMGELSIIFISIAAIVAWWQTGKEKREETRRRKLEEQYKRLMPKANSVYKRIAQFLVDILQDQNYAPLINLARPTNESNILVDDPALRIKIKAVGSGYLLSYSINKLNRNALPDDDLKSIRNTLQGAINQRISNFGINGLCPAKDVNTFLKVMGKPEDKQTFVYLCIDYDEHKLHDSDNDAPVICDIAADNDYGY